MSNYKSYYLKSLGLKEDQLPGGKGDETPPEQIDPTELEKGIEVEMEHTQDPALAREIAMDHLTEDPHYYSSLKNAGMDDHLPSGDLGREPFAPEKKGCFDRLSMGRLLSPTAINCTPVIAVAVRGSKYGDLPAGGRVDDPEKARYGGLQLLPQGGVKGDPEKARLGGWEKVKNIGANSQGAYSDTPASDAIKSSGGHFTPDNPEITQKEAPETNKAGSDAIHPMQVQQLGNKPIEDDGTGRDGQTCPPAAEAGIEGGSAPAPKAEPHPMSKFIAGDEKPVTSSKVEEPKKPEKPNTGPWGIEMEPKTKPEPEKFEVDDEDETETDDIENNSDDDNKEKDKMEINIKEGWTMGNYTPPQQQSLSVLQRHGFREVSTFPAEPDAEGGNMGDQVIIVVQKKAKFGRLSGEIDPEGLVNGQPVEQFVKGSMEEKVHVPGRMQKLAGIRPFNNEAGLTSEVKQLKELVGRLNAKGKVTPTLPKAIKYLEEMGYTEKGGQSLS